MSNFDQLPSDVAQMLFETMPVLQAHQTELKAEEEDRIEELIALAEEIGIEVVRIDQPICNCSGPSWGHPVVNVDFDFEAWKDEARTWLSERPRKMHLYRSYRSGDQGEKNGKRRRYRICSKFVEGVAEPLTLLARQSDE